MVDENESALIHHKQDTKCTIGVEALIGYYSDDFEVEVFRGGNKQRVLPAASNQKCFKIS
jgi:hypothetical protein